MGKGLVDGYLAGHDDVTHTDEGVLDYLIEKYNIRTMLDIGCGPGGMLDVASSRGIHAIGIDGDYTLPGRVDRVTFDFTKEKWDKAGKYDLAWSVEFVEHVEEKYRENFLAAFDKCKRIVMTGAPPGTPGNHHVNCQPPEYWIKVFESRGFRYNEDVTNDIKEHSTMKRDFIRDNVLFFEDKYI